MIAEAGLSPRAVYLWTLPMFHCNGWCFTWAVTATAPRTSACAKVEPEPVWDLLDERGRHPLLRARRPC